LELLGFRSLNVPCNVCHLLLGA